jgi:ankyrin repeat protein
MNKDSKIILKSDMFTLMDDLILLCENDQTDLIVIMLSEKNVNLEVKDENEASPLIITCIKKNIEMCKLLLLHGANINSSDKFGNTALHYCSIYGYLNILDILIKNGANIEAKNNIGQTPLHNASLCSQSIILDKLIENGANIEAKNNKGETPLHNSSSYGIKKNVKILINNHGADINSFDNRHNTILITSSIYGRLDIIKFLLMIPNINKNCKNINNHTFNSFLKEEDQIYIYNYIEEEYCKRANIKPVKR